MARDKNKRSLITFSHYLFDFWKEELREEIRKGRQEADPVYQCNLFLDLSLPSPDRDLSTKLITHSTLGLAENT